jgi:4-hydroxybenzoate polyprenyltransferase
VEGIRILNKIKVFFDLIKFEHSIFALPFAYLGLFLAEGGLPHFRVFFWVTVAMIAIRTSAMCLNRLIDQAIDEQNPRTKNRGEAINILKRSVIWMITIVSIVVSGFAAYQLNFLCFILLPVPLLLIWGYPYLKRITWCSHFILGTILGIAPYAGWLASRPEWAWPPLILMIAVASWVSGFDLFYALQDIEFDRTQGLKSFPARFGARQTIWFAKILHGTTLLALAVFGRALHLGIWYWAGWLIAAGLIFKEHRLIGRFGLTKINEAFFNMNALVSLVIFIGMTLELTLRF